LAESDSQPLTESNGIRKRIGVVMYEQHIVAVYSSRNEAEQAFRAARGSGIPSHKIRMSGADISVLLDGGASDAKINALEEILRRYRPLDVRIEEDGRAKKAGGPSAAAAPKKVGGPKGEEEEIIPLPREEPKVGAKATDRVHHIRTYVVEEPFEKEVSLSDERLVVDRRAAASEQGGEISERDYEFHERHEEPVVEMETRTMEELVVRKESTQHTERVRGTARRTEAKMEKEKEASVAASTSSPGPASHAPALMKGRS
jgi:hypothetical protein